MSHHHSWELRGTTARLLTDALRATLEMNRPEQGLEAITARLQGHQLRFDAACLLGVRGRPDDARALETTDYYVRGDDAIVSCRFTARPEIGLQVYWRAVRDETTPAAGIEAIVSAQTELLDSDPASTVTSRLPAGSVLTMATDGQQEFRPVAVTSGASCSGGRAILIRFPDAGVSFLEMAHPSDDRGAVISLIDGQLQTSYPVLTERLEKGVIRRSRVRAIFLPREDDFARAAKLVERFAASPLPLTS